MPFQAFANLTLTSMDSFPWDMNRLETQQQLFIKKFPNLSQDFVNTIFSSPISTPIIDFLLTVEPWTFHEDDPLLIIIPNIHNPDSLAYFNGGNCTLSENAPGKISCAEDEYIIVGPYALGKFICSHPGVDDRSAGHGLTFQVKDLRTLDSLSATIRHSKQFRRLGNVAAELLGKEHEDKLVSFVAIPSMEAEEQLLEYFNIL